VEISRAIRLYGVGLGPGDPALVTLGALRVLEQVELIIVPSSHARPVGRAEQVVRALLGDPTLLRLAMPMTPGLTGVGERRRVLRDAIRANGALLADASSCAFATLGDPTLYSTFSLFVEALAEEGVRTSVTVIPGIPAFLSLASLTTTNLLDNDERLHLIPATGEVAELDAALMDPGAAIVIYKLTSNFEAIRSLIVARGRQEGAMVGLELGTDDIQVLTLEQAPSTVPYFATIIVPVLRSLT
jgi:precorrin-2/cobalt-factor-2 C20-methyltransferase